MTHSIRCFVRDVPAWLGMGVSNFYSPAGSPGEPVGEFAIPPARARWVILRLMCSSRHCLNRAILPTCLICDDIAVFSWIPRINFTER